VPLRSTYRKLSSFNYAQRNLDVSYRNGPAARLITMIWHAGFLRRI